MLDFRKYENVPRFQLDRRPGRSRLKLTCPACGKAGASLLILMWQQVRLLETSSEDVIMNGLAVMTNGLPARMWATKIFGFLGISV